MKGLQNNTKYIEGTRLGAFRFDRTQETFNN